MKGRQEFGEIVASGLTSWSIQTWELTHYPSFGALIYLDHEDQRYFGVIADIQTGPKDAQRTPVAFGKTMEELRREQPHIFKLLQTTVTALPLGYVGYVGYALANKIVHEIPKQPPAIHAFAHACSSAEVNFFFSDTRWIITFFALAQNHQLCDELFIALIRYAHTHGALTSTNIQEIIDTFCLLTHDNYQKLKIFLQRIEAFIY